MATAAQKSNRIDWVSCRGMNDFDPPESLPDDMAADMRNVVIVRGGICRRRYGSTSQTFSGASFSGFSYLMRFVPASGEAAAELHWVSDDSKILRVAGGTMAAALSLTDAISSRPQDAHSAQLNGKEYIAYDSAVDRLHVYDPVGSTSAVRRAGLAAPPAPTASDTGNPGVDVTRRYRIQGRVKNGSDVRRASNLGASLTHNPAGAFTVTVTKPTLSEGETHWVVYASADQDDAVFYRISDEIAVATTTFEDTFDPADYADVFDDAAPTEGINSPFPSVKFLCATSDRLLGFGAWESTSPNGRVWFSPVLDSSTNPSIEDDERSSTAINAPGYIDIGRDNGAVDRAIVGPVDGNIFVFQSRGVYMLIPTANADVPFRRITLSPSLGAVNQWSTFVGEDENGYPCVYFLDPVRGPYRYGKGGFQWLGYDVQTFWSGVNLDASTRVACGMYDAATKRCYWTCAWSVQGTPPNTPTRAIVFHVSEGESTEDGIRFGWVRWDGGLGLLCEAITMVLFSSEFAATMSLKLVPFWEYDGSRIVRVDVASAVDDLTELFGWDVTSKVYRPAWPELRTTLGKAWVQGKSVSLTSCTVELRALVNYNTDYYSGSVVFAQSGLNNLRRILRVDGLAFADAWAVQLKLFSSTNETAQIDRVALTLDTHSEEVGNDQP